MSENDRGPVRVLHALVRLGSGGVEQRRLTLARGLPKQEYEQVVICTDSFGGLPEEFEKSGCKVLEIDQHRRIFDPKPYCQLLKVIKDFNPHIIHGAVYEGVALAAISGSLGRVPVIIGEETSQPSNRSWKGNALYRMFAGLCHHMVGVSPAVVDYLTKTIFLPSDKVTLINNGVAEKAPISVDKVQSMRLEFGFPSGSFIIGTVGRVLDDDKRISDLIRALAIISKSNSSVYLLIVGSGPDEAALKRLAQDFGVAHNVVFAGYQANPRPFYQLMDVFSLASSMEAFGLVLVEAMFAELPVVATRVGGIPSIVEEGNTGYLVPPFQPEALADAILSLIDDHSLRRSMGKRGRKRALEHFSADRYVRDVDALYKRLLIERNVL